MTTIHTIVAKFQDFPFSKNEGLLILGVDDNSSSCYVNFSNRSRLLDALLCIFEKNPDLLTVCSDAVKLASSSSSEKKELSPNLQKFLDKILKDLHELPADFYNIRH